MTQSEDFKFLAIGLQCLEDWAFASLFILQQSLWSFSAGEGRFSLERENVILLWQNSRAERA